MSLTLDPSQQAAVDMAVEHRVVVITGGPGTGKTTTLKAILDAYAAIGIDRDRVLLASPTGKAARRMAEQTGANAKTIHRLLEWGPEGFARDADNPLDADAVVVDEASMLDVELAALLFAAIPDGCRLILMGDADQLPSVGPGSVLRDVIASGVISVAKLNTIHRQGEHSAISVAAHAAIHGEELPRDADDFSVVLVDDLDDVALAAMELYAATGARILTPQRTTRAGVDALNDRLQESNHSENSVLCYGRKFVVGDPVMQTKNDYGLDVMNGESGIIIDITGGDIEVDYGDREVVYSGAARKGIRLAYASTIHKAQGSEYDDVVVVCHSAHSHMLDRELLYTAITRGKKRVTVIGNRKGIRGAIRKARASKRHTGLAKRLQGERYESQANSQQKRP